ncbi:hypothetical protein [Legionella spiritensis]|uniref:hypothetical protein n=1 Tax=Legionella spiritensis TaxID=452 RepID=UPI000F6E4023|nr:hypothetical protein [Legionella spiritensis]VEG92054.1 Uncharacterised protein [Legionella spiritensis]
MKKKAVLVIAPIMPDSSEMAGIAASLSFLTPCCDLEFLDPLTIIDQSLPDTAYYEAWQQQFADYSGQYDAFIGFAFGGVILQQCFSVLENYSRPVLLLSAPTFADDTLSRTLGQVITCCEADQLEQGLSLLYRHVYHPNPQPFSDWSSLDRPDAKKRMITGLRRVLATDSSAIVRSTTHPHLHLIGACSDLVNANNVIPPATGKLVIVPKASMRVLQDNPSFCKPLIQEVLCGET